MSSRCRTRGEIRAVLECITRARCPSRCPRPPCTWRRCAAWTWSWRVPRGSRCRARSWTRRAPPRAPRAARSPRPPTARAALKGAHVVYAKEWGSTSHYGDAEADARAARRTQGLVRARGLVRRSGARARLMHCLPVRRNVAVADEVLDGPRAAVRLEARNRSDRADGGAAPHAVAETPFEYRSSSSMMHEPTRSFHRRARAEKRGALHPHVQEQGVRHQGGRRGVRRTRPRRAR